MGKEVELVQRKWKKKKEKGKYFPSLFVSTDFLRNFSDTVIV